MAMKKKFILGLAIIGTFLTSCNDFLQRDPMDFADETAYFNTVNDLKIYDNTFYSLFPKMNPLWGGLFVADNSSDNQAGKWANNLFYPGDKKTVTKDNSEWKFDNLRGINFFINKVNEKIASKSISGSTEYINHYLGEAYFFRAYEYFRLLSNYGDVPILSKMMENNLDSLVSSSVRVPRNEVARFILKDLDKAAELMQVNAPESGRLSQDAAYLLKARVALYEATWEKYHAETAFVPGNSKWPGASTHPDFQFKAGSAEAEYNFFFQEAIDAADLVASRRKLDNDYIDMFNSLKTFSNSDEVILARYYLVGVNSHGASNYLGRTGGGTGFTRSLVNSFLMQSGKPIYADQDYKGDKVMYEEFKGRDVRLTSSTKAAGSNIVTKTDPLTGQFLNDTISYYRPFIYLSGNESSPTGYEMKKFVSYEKGQDEQGKGTSATPIFRAAEAYLIYLEAYYEKNGTLGGNCDAYWRALRTRAGVNPDYNLTIAATDMTQENDLATKWHGSYIDKTLYNIRRERRCEFIGEGMRLDDLKRWRALDNMTDGYQVEGMNLWAEMYKMYSSSLIAEGIVSQQGISTYIRPLQVTASGSAYNGYNFPKAHYLEPIPVAEFALSKRVGDSQSTLYQNPGWPTNTDGTADYSANYD